MGIPAVAAFEGEESVSRWQIRGVEESGRVCLHEQADDMSKIGPQRREESQFGPQNDEIPFAVLLGTESFHLLQHETVLLSIIPFHKISSRLSVWALAIDLLPL